jgi:uncharacterized protein
MNCPKCGSEMELVIFENIEVDRCENCCGIWFDMLEKEDLSKIENSETIDIGEQQIGEMYNQIRQIDCPKCNVRMIQMIDKAQFHIHYESCPSCYGVFFDAGEFRDLKEHTVIERFKEMLETLRTNL